MPRAAPLQSNFNGGELSPLIGARPSLDQYKTGLETCLNWIPTVQGPLTQRPGTNYVTPVKNEALATRLQRFEFSTTQAYVLEFSNLCMRVFRNHGLVLTGGLVPYELVTPYLTADVFALKYAQSADTLYVAHPSYKPQKITRTADNAWTITPITFVDGPYLVQNTTTTTLTPSATTGAITITASSALFAATDVGRLVRIKNGATWGNALITGFTSSTLVNATVISAFAAATAATTWRLGMWSDTTGYPGAVTFFQDRLWWGGSTNNPQTVASSNSGDYENMAPTAADGSVTASMSVVVTLNANDVNVIRWMLDDERGLLIGTTGGEWLVKATSVGDAVTPTNVAAVRSTTYGSANVQAIRVARATLFVQRSARKLREMAYVYIDDGFKAPDMTVLAEHITLGGMTQLAYQQEPQGVVWAVRADGVLLGFTYNREQQIMGWSRHTLGGFSDAGKTVAAKVESIACIPAPDGTRDELWLVVNRYINGATHRYIEYMSKIWGQGDTLNASNYLDASLGYSGVPVTVLAGLGHLEGQAVAALTNGSPVTGLTVTGGQVTIPFAASTVQIGLNYNADGKTLRPEAGAADGTSVGKTKRSNRVDIRVVDTVGLKVGPDSSTLQSLQFRTTAIPAGQATPLFSGDKSDTLEADYDFDGQIFFRQDQPLPATIAAIAPQLVEQDRA